MYMDRQSRGEGPEEVLEERDEKGAPSVCAVQCCAVEGPDDREERTSMALLQQRMMEEQKALLKRQAAPS